MSLLVVSRGPDGRDGRGRSWAFVSGLVSHAQPISRIVLGSCFVTFVVDNKEEDSMI
jgi:hypothetical protein